MFAQTMGSGDHRKTGETIHSGQFMVSNLEVDTQDDEDEIGLHRDEEDDDKAEIVDPVINTNPPMSMSIVSGAACKEIQRYIPQQMQMQPSKSSMSSVEIDTDLSTVFNTLNVTYTQKLTSPKWNPFKGIRLRWKEKIRLNNVIWRCWHMQFIMKKKTLVCQFASPLDVDIHNTPQYTVQAILLEGKYWKRKLNVIKAEYKKWRRFNVNKALGATVGDTSSELDIFEWPNNDMLMITENMPSDTLFSTLSQYPFPDIREIARGAGRADFIQPSLGPLQPNFEDLMDLDLDFLNFNTRLAPVPEEGSEDYLKAIDYNYPVIGGGSDQMSTSSIQEIPMNTNTSIDQPSSTIQYTSSLSVASAPLQQTQISSNHIQQQQQQTQYSVPSPPLLDSSYISQSNLVQMSSPTVSANVANDEMAKGGKPKYLKGYSRSIGRERHNYEKCPPTTHQTMAYNLMTAQQQQQQQPQQYQNVIQMSPTIVSNTSVISTNTTGNIGSPKILTQSVSLPITNQSQVKIQPRSNSTPTTNYASLLTSAQHSAPNLQSLQQQPAQDAYSKTAHSPNSYRLYHGQQQPYKIPSQNSSYSTSRSLRHTSPPSAGLNASNSNLAENYKPQVQPHPTKEMYRSNSLPINSNFLAQKDETFAVPKYQASKGTNPRSRSRSNSFVMKQTTLLPGIRTTTSEPMLNQTSSALLAQLLTTNTASSLLNKQVSSSSSAINVLSKQPQQQIFQMPLQSQSTKPIPTASSPLASSSSSSTQSTLNFSASMSSQSLSPESIDHDDPEFSPGRQSSGQCSRNPRDRRVGHIHAEQKRRYNIKNGFDLLHSLIPQLQQNPNAKLSKAAMLQKGAEYIKQLRAERSVKNEEMEALRREIEALNNSLSNLQTALPANGAPVLRQRTGRVRELYNEYVRYRTLENWKFWIFGLIFEPLMNTFNQSVSVASMDEMCRTSLLWVDQHCSLVELRPAVSNKLRHLSTTTDILSDPPTTLRDEVMKAISKPSNRSGSSNGSDNNSNI